MGQRSRLDNMDSMPHTAKILHLDALKPPFQDIVRRPFLQGLSGAVYRPQQQRKATKSATPLFAFCHTHHMQEELWQLLH